MADPSGLLEAGNIDLHNRPRVQNPDGSISTVRSVSMNFGDGEVLVPTVSEDGRIMTDDEAADQYRRTGRHLGRFSTPDHADAYAQQLHTDQEREYVGTEGTMADTPQSALAAAREMVKASGKPMSTENLNRASLALAQGKESTDFDSKLEAMANPSTRSSTRQTAASTRKDVATEDAKTIAANTNRPVDTAKAGDTPRPTLATSPTTGTAAGTSEPMGTRGDGTIQTPLTHDRKTTRTVSLPEYDAAGNPLGSQSMVTHNSPQSAPVGAQAAARPSSTAPVPIEEYVDQMVAEPKPEEPLPIPPPNAPPATTMPPPLPAGSVAPVQQNPAAAAAATSVPAPKQPAVADAAQTPAPRTFREYVDAHGGTGGMAESFGRSPAMGLLLGGRGLNTGAGLAGGARGATGPTLALPAPAGAAARMRGNPNMATTPEVMPMGGAGQPQIGGPPAQLALPSSYGPAIPRGNMNASPSLPPISLRPGGSQAIPMPGAGQPRIGTDRGNVGKMQDTAQARLSAILRSRGQ